MIIFLTLFFSLVSCVTSQEDLLINPDLGVSGFPNCNLPENIQPANLTTDEAAKLLVCEQLQGKAGSAKIACVGDSITAGSHSSGPSHAYPQQLQNLLGDNYTVTNLGASGATMLKNSNLPYWTLPQYNTLITNKWDVVIIMLGTNDAKDRGSGGPDNWHHDCGGVNATSIIDCTFAADYAALIAETRTLGTKADGPQVFVAIPPPLMQQGAIGANQTVINSVFPKLIPIIASANRVGTKPIDVYSEMGGVVDWKAEFPSSCQLHSPWKPCSWWCDQQSCDQCHPNDVGYAYMATVFHAAITAADQ